MARAATVLAGQGPAIAVVSLGGALGAASRHGLSLLLPHAGGFPWATLLVNVSGCLAIGALIVVLTEALTAPPLARPFLGTGFLGGYTTFSAYAGEAEGLLSGGSIMLGGTYLVLTLLAALAAAWAGTRAARLVLARSNDGQPR
ncbi:CrcB family protein [Hoyosella sp. G463]|uniref:Fluoride-specific ion channel FluC n=1 Tax=Lolliginicoccus lacisalsi TaxID=2742202 RepID=A0A927JF34_9ACTN|nr:CrcB family protein [Lolliginicoccus lacisalsi]MBD8507492.1 CrcB family protein [Lolliginicoccus lacisalsi]